ncbi:TPA: DNA repair protein RadC [Stenotrophomonas maltophilia]|uniref:JAB domain-containing protein n=1 Tax=Stenotrophomonas maltophilia TaxID=40324 RepID=UPI00287AA594|nr:DNA repair protein RadC [Stenotrophomonas maltophilia]HDX0901825.1 DNA repair protein RadC [Stenotrophomonas maltophilia]HDX0919789.1 DNA repair protein RadC [Stenotrophomonas maltophilia]
MHQVEATVHVSQMSRGDKSEEAAVRRALRILEKRMNTAGPLLNDPDVAGKFFRLRLGGETREHFEVAFLDTRHQLIAVERLFSGSIDGAQIHPRIVVQRALAQNAAAVLLAHNHPSGCCEPSTADRAVTSRLKDALALMDVRVLDHLVVSAGQSVSMARRGYL